MREVAKIDEDSEIEALILRLVAERGADKTICPSEVARALGGANPDDWRRLMQPIRRVAVRLVKEGRVAILRKGKPVADPEDFRGVYRIGWGAATAIDWFIFLAEFNVEVCIYRISLLSRSTGG